MNAHLLEAPLPVSAPAARGRFETLAYLEAHDAVLNLDYVFAAYKETDRHGGWRVCVRSQQTAGAVFEPAAVRLKAREVAAQGKSWFPWGYFIDPSANDPRCLQFRVHVRNGKPAEIEIFVRLRSFDGSPAEPHAVRFAWPAS